jgi:acetoacetyl-CoA synthetase
MKSLHIPFDPVMAANSQMASFMQRIEQSTGEDFSEDYQALHRWACEHVGEFWRLFLGYCDLPQSGQPVPSLLGNDIEHGRFFPDLRLNYAECLLRPLPGVSDDSVAIVFRSESGHRQELSRGELRDKVLSIAAALKQFGVKAGDRVVAFARNTPETVVACLAATALGASWSSVGPDLAASATLSRFSQLEPVVLFAHTEFVNHGASRGLEEQVREVVAGLPSLKLLVLLGGPEIGGVERTLKSVNFSALEATASLPLDALERFPFEHPLFVLFSSGTTGAPKCIVHGAGGTLLEHLKEHRLHSDFRPGERLYFHTSCGWMMWNWLVSALATGITIMLFDGSVSYPDATALLKLIEEERINVFGTSPAYVQLLRDSGIEPRTVGEFPQLRALQSTGSILFDEQFDWIRENFKAVPIHSISGGSDIIGCFVLGNPLLPVYRGESQSISLGLDVRVWTDSGLERTGSGELLCVNPFPSRPVFIWGDSAGTKFHESYFVEHEGYWTHGDLIELADCGSARIRGRSDGTMKIRGVRIGPAELYSIVLAIPGIRECMAVDQEDRREAGGRRLVLLVVLRPEITLDRQLILRIKRELNQKASPVHVPAVVVDVSALPQTLNGKYSERAARDTLNGRKPKNLSALRNPACLDEIVARVPRVV